MGTLKPSRENRYAKKEILRVMSWVNQEEEYKFKQLKHYFQLYFRLMDKSEPLTPTAKEGTQT